MKPAVKLALAYCYATGELPIKLHLETWRQAHERLTFVEDLNERIRTSRTYRLSDEALEAIAGHPLKLATDWFLARGFKPEQQRRRTSHYVAFTRLGDPFDVRGLAYRSGNGSIDVRHEERPFVTSFSLDEAEPVWPAILRPAHYAGERQAGETGRDYLQRAIGAYREGVEA